MARVNPAAKHGRAFGSYGFCKSLGYTAGPLLGGVVVWAGGLPLLFGVMTALAAAVAAWVALAVPAVPPLPRARQTVLDLARRLSQGSFLRPTTALASATAAHHQLVSAGRWWFDVESGRAAGQPSPVTAEAAAKGQGWGTCFAFAHLVLGGGPGRVTAVPGG